MSLHVTTIVIELLLRLESKAVNVTVVTPTANLNVPFDTNGTDWASVGGFHLVLLICTLSFTEKDGS